MTQPLVTVIITVYKRTEFLAEAVSSVLRQTFTSFEILVSDDANQVVTRALCAKLNVAGRIRYRSNPCTLGTPLNIAAALREARGKYIVILNDDDLLEPQMLDQLVTPLERIPQAVLAFGNHRIMDRKGRELAHQTVAGLRDHGHATLSAGLIEQPLEFAVRGGAMVAFGCVFRKEVCEVNWLVPQVADAYDYWLAVKLAERGAFYFVPEYLMSWRQHENSESARLSPERGVGVAYILTQVAALRLNENLRNYVTNRLAHALYIRGSRFLAQGWNEREAREILCRSLTTKWHAKAALAWLLTFVPARLRRLAFNLWRRVPRELRTKADLGHRSM